MVKEMNSGNDTKSGEISKAQAVRDYVSEHRRAKNQSVVKALAEIDIETTPGYVRQMTFRQSVGGDVGRR